MRVARVVLAVVASVQIGTPGVLAAQNETYLAPADELAEARIIIEAMLPADKREQMILDMATAVGNQAAAGFMTGPIFKEPGIKAIIDQYLADLPNMMRPLFATHMPQILEATALSYTREFTLAELQDISAFARTTSGQRYFLNLQKFQSDPAVAAANQAMFADLAPVQQAAIGRLQAQVQEYLAANPDVLERLTKDEANK
jgi:hypothetical protein